MFVNLPAEVITQGMSMIHGKFSKFFRTEYFNGESNKTGGPLAILRGIQQCFIEIQHRCVRATDQLSGLVIETAGQRPATLKDFRTQEMIVLERQTRRKSLRSFASSEFERKVQANVKAKHCYAECNWICALTAFRSIPWRCCDHDKSQESVLSVSGEILQYQWCASWTLIR